MSEPVLRLLGKWLKFSEDVLGEQWWAVTEQQDPETYTAEGRELEALQAETRKLLLGKCHE